MTPDHEIVRCVLAGDKAAFGHLIDRHRPEAVRLARRLLRRAADAEDVVQEALLHAFLSLGKLRSPERFRGWLLGIVLNLARSRWRTRPEYPLEVPHDLITRLLDVGGLRVEKVAVTSLREETFYGSISVHAGGTVHEIDARPSDAIAIALERGAPIFVTEETFQHPRCHVLRAGQELPGLEAHLQKKIADGKTAPDPVEREYRSFRSLPRHEGRGLRQRTGADR